MTDATQVYWNTSPAIRARMLEAAGMAEPARVDELTRRLSVALLWDDVDEKREAVGVVLRGSTHVCWCACYSGCWTLLAIAPEADCVAERLISREQLFAAKWPASWITRRGAILRNGATWVAPVNPDAVEGSRMAGRIGTPKGGKGPCMMALCVTAEGGKPTTIQTDANSPPVRVDQVPVKEWWILSKNLDGFDVLWARNQTVMANSRFMFMRMGLAQKQYDKRARKPGEASTAREHIAELIAHLETLVVPSERMACEEEIREWRKLLRG